MEITINQLGNDLVRVKKDVQMLKEQIKDGVENGAEQMEKLKLQVEAVREEMDNTLELKLTEVESCLSSFKELMKQNEEDLKATLFNSDFKDKKEVGSGLEMRSDVISLMNTDVYEWKIRNLGWQATLANWECSTEVLPLHGYQFGVAVHLKHDHNQMTLVSLTFKNIYKTKQPIDTKSMPKIILILKDSRDEVDDEEENSDVILYCDQSFATTIQYDHRVGSWPLINHTKFISPPYLTKDNGVTIKILVEPPSIARSFYSNDGVLLWRLDNYKMRRQMERNQLVECQDSPYFYTSPHGYRMSVKLYLNGYKGYIGYKGFNGLVCHVGFRKGEFDAFLAYEFKHRTTITVINRKDSSKHAVATVDKDHAQWYKVGIEYDLLVEKNDFVKDDCLLVKVVIQTL